MTSLDQKIGEWGLTGILLVLTGPFLYLLFKFLWDAFCWFCQKWDRKKNPELYDKKKPKQPYECELW